MSTHACVRRQEAGVQEAEVSTHACVRKRVSTECEEAGSG